MQLLGIQSEFPVEVFQYYACRLGVQLGRQIRRARYALIPGHGLSGDARGGLLRRVALVPELDRNARTAPRPDLGQESLAEIPRHQALLADRAVLVQRKAQDDVGGLLRLDVVHERGHELGGVEARQDGERSGAVPPGCDRHARSGEAIVHPDRPQRGEPPDELVLACR